MFKYKLIIEYNGKNFYGSQRQSSFRTVEGILNKVLKELLGQKIELFLVSRTDTAVNALYNLALIKCKKKIDKKIFLEKINFILPKDLKLKNIVKIRNNKFKVKYKIYRYFIYNSLNQPTLFNEYVWWIKDKLYLGMLRKAAKFISARKNFCFATTKDFIKSSKNTNCKIKIKISKFQEFIKIDFIGNRFLHRLVRNITSLLVDVARYKISFEQLKIITKNWKYFKNKPAPPHALFLWYIKIGI